MSFATCTLSSRILTSNSSILFNSLPLIQLISSLDDPFHQVPSIIQFVGMSNSVELTALFFRRLPLYHRSLLPSSTCATVNPHNSSLLFFRRIVDPTNDA